MKLVFDIEADGLLDTVTTIHCIVAKDVNLGNVYRFSPEQIHEGLSLLEQAEELIGHNIISYDIPALKKVHSQFNPSAKLFDTLIAAKLIYANIGDIDIRLTTSGKLQNFQVWNKKRQVFESAIGRHSLEAWGQRLKCHKGDFGQQNDWNTFTTEMLDYCVQDVEVTHKLYDKLMSKGFSEESIHLEMLIKEVINQQIIRGWQFNEYAAQDLYAKLVQRRTELYNELQKIFPGWYSEMKAVEYYYYDMPTGDRAQAKSKKELENFVYTELNKHQQVSRKTVAESIQDGPVRQKHTPFNPGSRQHVARVLKEKYNWQPRIFSETGQAKVDEAVLATLDYPEVEVLREYFVIAKRIGQVAEGAENWLTAVKNGRIYGYVDTLGTITGRATHRNPNLSQVPAVRKPFGEECRQCFTAKPGYVLVGADADALEARCLAHYLAEWDNGEYVFIVDQGKKEEGTDIHTRNMQAAGLTDREKAKTFFYAFIYGAGDEKIGKIISKGKKDGKKLKEDFLKGLPALANLMGRCSNSHDKEGCILGLDGRKIYTRSEHAALNTLLQGAGAIICKRWLLFIHEEFDRRGWNQDVNSKGYQVGQVGWIHDETQIETLPELAEEVGKICLEAMKKVEQYYSFKCPLKANYSIGKNWKETH